MTLSNSLIALLKVKQMQKSPEEINLKKQRSSHLKERGTQNHNLKVKCNDEYVIKHHFQSNKAQIFLS